MGHETAAKEYVIVPFEQASSFKLYIICFSKMLQRFRRLHSFLKLKVKYWLYCGYLSWIIHRFHVPYDDSTQSLVEQTGCSSSRWTVVRRDFSTAKRIINTTQRTKRIAATARRMRNLWKCRSLYLTLNPLAPSPSLSYFGGIKKFIFSDDL